MINPTGCPFCGAGQAYSINGKIAFSCKTITGTSYVLQSTECEQQSLRAKVAAQQELLKEAADALRTLHHWSDVATHMGHATLIACRENAAEVLTKLEESK